MPTPESKTTIRQKFALFKDGKQISDAAGWLSVRKHALKIGAAFLFKVRSNQSWRLRDGYEISPIKATAIRRTP
jgi:hypothetical protein